MFSFFPFPFSSVFCYMLMLLTQLSSLWKKSANPFDDMMNIETQKANRIIVVHLFCPRFLKTFGVLCTFFPTA